MLHIYNYRESFYQWDTNQKITGEDLKVGDEIHFHNSQDKTALVVVAYEFNGRVVADVPNILMQTPSQITAYRYVEADASESTVDVQKFTVLPRVRPDDYVYTETEAFNLQVEIGRYIAAAKASGYFEPEPKSKLQLGDTVLSEKRLQVMMALVTLKTARGTYIIGNNSSAGSISGVTFMSNDKTFTRMSVKVESDEAIGAYSCLYYDDTRVAEHSDALGGWVFVAEGYKTLDLGNENQELLESEHQWFTSMTYKPMITFTLNGFALETEGGTLWGEFSHDDGTSSTHNRDGYVVLDEYGSSGFQYYIVDESNKRVMTTDEIKPGGVYVKGAAIV